MTTKELRAKIYTWLYDCYKISVQNKKNNINRKKLKKILDEYNTTQPPTTQNNKTPKVVPKKKEYLNTKGPVKVWRNF